MTPEELEEAVKSGKPERCLALLRGAPETARRALAPAALRLRHHISDYWGLQKGPLAALAEAVGSNNLNEASCIAFLGTASLSELKKLGNRGLYPSEHHLAVFQDRRPSWLPDYAEWLLELNPWYWRDVHPLVLEGLIPRLTSDAWFVGLIGQGHQQPTLRELLAGDPALVEDVWRLFEVEGGGEHSLAAVDKFRAEPNQWSHVLVALAGEGVLDRQRLLDASLDALERDFAQFRAGWFSRFHEALSPTVEERAARTDRYLGLLGSRIPPTVSAALKAIEIVEKAGHLPAGALVDGVGPALLAREKKTVTQALKLLDRAAKREKSLAGQVAVTAAAALVHEAPDVQEAALTLIERHGDGTDTLREGLRARLQDAAPSLRERLAVLIGDAAASPPAAAAGADSLAALLDSTSRLPADLARRSGVEAAARAAREASPDVPAIHFQLAEIPRLSPETRIEPIRDLDELLDVFARVLENQGPPDDIERAMDGLSRLCAERPADWEKRIGPLRKRARTLRAHESQRFGGWDLRGDLACLVVAWLDGDTAAVSKPSSSLPGFLAQRLLELARRVAGKRTAPLLSAPTHAGGWVDPRALACRLRESAAPPMELDLVYALLRLAPDGRTEALQQAGDLAAEPGEALRYALGAEGTEIGASAPLWVAAARARRPLEDDPAVEARHPGLGPGAGRMPRPKIAWSSERRTFSGQSWTQWSEKLVLDPPLPMKVKAAYPTVRHYGDRQSHESAWENPDYSRWCLLIWPGGRESLFASGALAISDNLVWGSARWGDRVYLEPLLDPDTPLGPMGRLLLGLGLAGKEPGQHGLATDALIAAVTDGRLDGALFGATLGIMLQPSPVHPPRLAKTLADAARASPLHAQVVREALIHALGARPDKRPADLAPLLELLRELCVQTGEAVIHSDARSFLESMTGGGKAVALAKALLALTPAQNTRRLAAAYALAGRLERAERWGKCEA